jgi:hypothetical protein
LRNESGRGNNIMSNDYQTHVEGLVYRIDQLTHAIGGCSCGDATILGVIHSDTKPCSLPIVHRPLTDDEVSDLLDDYSDLGDDLLEITGIIEKAHGIGGINEV